MTGLAWPAAASAAAAAAPVSLSRQVQSEHLSNQEKKTDLEDQTVLEKSEGDLPADGSQPSRAELFGPVVRLVDIKPAAKYLKLQKPVAKTVMTAKN